MTFYLLEPLCLHIHQKVELKSTIFFRFLARLFAGIQMRHRDLQEELDHGLQKET